MSGCAQHKTNSPLEQLLEEIKFQRRKELRSQVGSGDWRVDSRVVLKYILYSLIHYSCTVWMHIYIFIIHNVLQIM